MCLPGYAAPLLLTCNTPSYSPSPTRVMPSVKDLSGLFPILQPPYTGGAGGCRRELSPASGGPKFAQDSPLTLHFPVLKSLKVCSTFCRHTRYHLPATTLHWQSPLPLSLPASNAGSSEHIEWRHQQRRETREQGKEPHRAQWVFGDPLLQAGGQPGFPLPLPQCPSCQASGRELPPQVWV